MSIVIRDVREHELDSVLALNNNAGPAILPLDAARLRGFFETAEYFRQALRAAKEAIDRGLETDIDTGLEIERQYFVGLFATEDRSIGMRSFIENGPGKARFVGR